MADPAPETFGLWRGRAILVLAWVVLALPRAVAESPSAPQDPLVELGRDLFSDPRLSTSGTVSCATCHDPARAFTDGLRESIGDLGIRTGANSATLHGLAEQSVFLHPLAPAGLKGTFQSQRHLAAYFGKSCGGCFDFSIPSVDFHRGPVLLTLEERCLTPLEAPAEMGTSIRVRVSAFGVLPGQATRFDAIFDEAGVGVTPRRVGRALAQFVRSIETPASPYAKWRDGDPDALGAAAERGLEVFTGRGKCASCHAGPALRDGKVYAIWSDRTEKPTRGERVFDLAHAREGLIPRSAQLEGPSVSPELKASFSAALRAIAERRAYSAGNFGDSELGSWRYVRTPTLWNVARTAPYLHDGSAETLWNAPES